MHTLLRPVMSVIVAGVLSACSGGSLPTATPTESVTDMASGSQSPSFPPDAPATDPAPAPPAPTDTPTGPGDAELFITVEPGHGAPAVHYTLVCRAGEAMAESSHPRAQAACAALSADPALLHRTPHPERICTEQYGGPQTALVTGAVDGIPVEARFSRTDGCEISEWNSAEDLLGADDSGL